MEKVDGGLDWQFFYDKIISVNPPRACRKVGAVVLLWYNQFYENGRACSHIGGRE